MDKIEITKGEDNFFYVKQGNKLAEKLDYTGMLGLVSALTIPDEKPFLHWMREIPEEKPYEPKEGDFVCDSNPICEYVYIFKSKKSDKLNNYYARFLLSNKALNIDCYCDRNNPRLATEEEKQILLDVLHKNGRDWDAEKKEIVPYKWKPKEGEVYWCVNESAAVGCYKWANFPADIKFYSIGNCFRTEEEAQEMADKFKELLKK